MFPTELPHANGQATYSIDGGPSSTFTIPGGGDTSIYNRKIFEVNGLSKEAHTIVVTYTSDGGSTPLVISQFYIEGGTNLRAAASGSGSESSVGGSSGSGSTSTIATTDPNGSTVSVANPTTNTAVVGGSGSSSTSPALLPGDNATPSDAAGVPNGGNSGGSTGGSSGSVGSNEGSSSSSNTPVGAIVGAVLGALAALLLLFLLMWYRRRKRIRLRDETVDNGPFRMTREEHPGVTTATPTTMYTNYQAPSMPTMHGSEPSVAHDSFSNYPTPVQAPVQHPAARTKGGPMFSSPYIANPSPYDNDTAMASAAHLIPSHHRPQASVDQSVSAYSAYTNSTGFSSAPSRAVFHEDSGVRIPAASVEDEPVVEFPPMYSAR